MKKKVCVLTLGGTIAYTRDAEEGVIQDLQPFIKSLDEVSEIAEVDTISFMKSSSSALLIKDIINLSVKIKSLIEEGYEGFVVIQGTDTIEETAFILQLIMDTDIPIIVTGAMRNPDMRGADGPANILASIRVAANNNCRGLGTLVVFNDEIHSGYFVRKIHPQSTEAFGSEFSLLGYLAEGIPSIRLKPIERRIPYINLVTDDVPDVHLYSVPIGDDGKLLTKYLDFEYKGLVLEGLGGGHTPTELVDSLEEIAKEMPVILSTRIGVGDTLTSTYTGYPGSEISLLSKGLISAGFLDGRRSRILLTLLLMSDCNLEEIKDAFKIFSKCYNRY